MRHFLGSVRVRGSVRVSFLPDNLESTDLYYTVYSGYPFIVQISVQIPFTNTGIWYTGRPFLGK